MLPQSLRHTDCNAVVHDSAVDTPLNKDYTMKLHTLLFVSVLLAGCSQAPGNLGDTKASNAGDAKPSAAETAATVSETPTTADQAAATKAAATGTIEAVDTAAGKITIAHGPVAELQWPAMTMNFKATPAQAASVQVGQKVRFEFEFKGADATITRIALAE